MLPAHPSSHLSFLPSPSQVHLYTSNESNEGNTHIFDDVAPLRSAQSQPTACGYNHRGRESSQRGPRDGIGRASFLLPRASTLLHRFPLPSELLTERELGNSQSRSSEVDELHLWVARRSGGRQRREGRKEIGGTSFASRKARKSYYTNVLGVEFNSRSHFECVVVEKRWVGWVVGVVGAGVVVEGEKVEVERVRRFAFLGPKRKEVAAMRDPPGGFSWISWVISGRQLLCEQHEDQADTSPDAGEKENEKRKRGVELFRPSVGQMRREHHAD